MKNFFDFLSGVFYWNFIEQTSSSILIYLRKKQSMVYDFVRLSKKILKFTKTKKYENCLSRER